MNPIENQARLARLCTREQAINLLEQIKRRGKPLNPYIEGILLAKATATEDPPEPGSTEPASPFVPVKCQTL